MKAPSKNILVASSGGALAETEMTFDQDSIEHLMSLLTDAYSDAVEACIREYSTNAYDSHQYVGSNKPIIITLPTSWSTYFSVEDFGVGMSEEDILQIYSKYGMSTKRESNDFVGMLGIGCKAGLALTGQFNIRSRKDGVEVQAVVSRNESGRGMIEIVSRENTTEPDGVKVTVPASGNVEAFQRKAMRFFSFWQPGTFEFADGNTPVYVCDHDNTEQITDDTWVVPADYPYEKKGVVVMGNVPYPAKGMVTDLFRNQRNMIHFAEIGEVEFTPSREELMYTPATEAYIESVVEAAEERIVESAQKEVSAASNYFDAWNVVQKYSERALGQRVTWNSLPVGRVERYRYREVYTWSFGTKKAVRDATRGISYPLTGNVIVVENYDNQTVVQNNIIKVMMAAKHDMEQNCHVVFLHSSEKADGIWKGLTKVDWTEAKKIRFGAKSSNGPKTYAPSEKYHVLGPNGWSVAEVDSDDNFIIVPYIHHSRRTRQFTSSVRELWPDHVIVSVEGNRVSKFKRNNPKHKSLDEAHKEKVDEFVAKYDKRQILTLRGYAPSVFMQIPADDILDPDLQKVVKSVQSLKGDESLKLLTAVKNSDEFRPDHRAFDELYEGYPLLEIARNETRNLEAVLEYINLIYKERHI